MIKKILSLTLSICLCGCMITSSKVEAISIQDSNVLRLYGDSRFDTAISIAKTYTGSSTLNNVVLATASNFPDALTGSVLASKLNAPILLVSNNPSDSDSQKTLKHIKASLPKDGNIYILGGKSVISDNFINTLKGYGYSKFVRLGGANREETSNLINKKINVSKGTPVVIVTESDFPDALSVSSIAGINNYPILLSKKNSLPQETKDLLKGIKPTKAYIIGGTEALSDSVVKDITSTTGLSKDSIIRISGKDRYETSLNIAKTFNLDTTNGIVATGNDFPDALTGSVLASKLKAPILLVNNTNTSGAKQYLDDKGIFNLYILGGKAVIDSNMENYLKTPATPKVVTYSDGKYLVNKDLPSGLYRVTLNDSALKMGYVERAKNVTMETDSIIANTILPGNGYVEILKTDVAVKLEGVTIEPINIKELKPSIKTEATDGIYLVGYDLAVGTYKVELTDTATKGYVERSRSVSMGPEDTIANERVESSSYLEIVKGDFAVKLQGVKITLQK